MSVLEPSRILDPKYRLTGRLRNQFTSVLIAVVITAIPLALLFSPGKQFYIDWTNTVWLVGYVGEYFAKHATFPAVISTNQIIGMPIPVFYGYLFLPIAGVLSALVGADVSVRCICFIATLSQTIAILVACRKVGVSKWIGFGLASIFAWRPYPLTNLYNRGDVTEFIAFTFVTSGAVLCLLYAPKVGWNLRSTIPGLFLALAVGTNPTAGVLGILVVALMALIILMFVADRRSFVLAVCVNVALAVVVLSPWIYAVAMYQSSLSLLRYPVLKYYPEIDNLANRLIPFPLDVRTLISGTNVSTPYLDAQISIPLLVIALSFFIVNARNRPRDVRRIWTISLLYGCAVLLISAFPALGAAIPGIQTFQFAYRFINVCDLALLFAAGAVLVKKSRFVDAHERQVLAAQTLMAGCVAAALISVGVKLGHGAAVEANNTLRGTFFMGSRAELLELPSMFYGQYDYASPQGSARNAPAGKYSDERIQLLTDGNAFGLTDKWRAHVTGIVTTNVEAFPWNHIVVNGKIRPTQATWTDANMIALTVRRGAELGFASQPTPTWRYLRIISFFTLVGWFLTLCAAEFVAKILPLIRRRGIVN